MFITQEEAKQIIQIAKQCICDENMESTIHEDGSLNILFPAENTYFSLHSASNGEIVKIFFGLIEKPKNITASSYVVRYLTDEENIYNFLDLLPETIEEMAMELEELWSKEIFN